MSKQLVHYTPEFNIPILCLQEAKAPETTQYVIEGFQFAAVGMGALTPGRKGLREDAGVGFV
eukprot:5808460-Alexandrium_andersonii.AAC.1